VTDRTDIDLTGIPELGLLDMVRLILSVPGPLTDRHRQELQAINSELERRDQIEARQARREQYQVRRLRQKIQQRIQS